MIKILITGSNGFIGKNLKSRLTINPEFEVIEFNRCDPLEILDELISQSDIIVHLAGENRPKTSEMLKKTNELLTKYICNCVVIKKSKAKIIFASSKHAESNSLYGLSKRNAEHHLSELNKKNQNNIFIYRLPGVFGKWCKPNYNSVIATFCHNIANSEPIHIDDNNLIIEIVYIDDVIDDFLSKISSQTSDSRVHWVEVRPSYKLPLLEIAKKITSYSNNRSELFIQEVGSGIDRALYSTFLTYLPESRFINNIKINCDNRGKFVEFIKTKKSGQISYATIRVGQRRGGHYHHTKTEKFIVITGKCLFRAKNIITNQCYEILLSSIDNYIVDSIPGWSHELINVGAEEVILLIWANEIFDINKSDTYFMEM